MVDLSSSVEASLTLVPQVLSENGDTTEATGVDRSGWGATRHIVVLGDSGDTLSGSLYLHLILQESDALASGYEAVSTDNDVVGSMVTAASGIFGVIDAPTEDQTEFIVEYHGSKRYSRVQISQVGNHSTGIIVGVHSENLFPRSKGATGVLPTP